MSQDVIRVSKTAADAYRLMADEFLAFTEDKIRETGSCVVAITGGTVVDGLFAVLTGEDYIDRVNWEEIYFLWTDERFVNHDDPDSYYGRMKRLVAQAIPGAVHMYGVRTCIGSVMNAAAGYEQEVKNVLRGLDKQSLDLAILDLGADGHTAGLFPKSAVLTDCEHLVVPVKDGKVWDRVSMTFHFLSQAQTVWFGVMGENKKAALKKVLFQREDCQGMSWKERTSCSLPGAVLCQDDICWFVDEETYPK